VALLELAMTGLSDATLESLEVGAAPLVQHFLQRLQLLPLLQRFLPAAETGCPEKLPSALTLCCLIEHLLLARQPLYALADFFARRTPEHFGLEPAQVGLLNDDRFARALDRLFEADCASLLTTLVMHTVRAFAIDLSQLHNDSTTVTFSGNYVNQAAAEQEERPPLITHGHNKDHRPDLKQLLYCVTVSADGAVPLHFKAYDGNTVDDVTHRETWLFLRQLVGHANFLYVADCKLASHDNLAFIAGEHGRFLTVLPRTRKEIHWLYEQARAGALAWQEVRRQKPRRKEGPARVWEGCAHAERSTDGYRLFWYRSSQKRANDAAYRQRLLAEFRTWHKAFQAKAQRQHFASEEEAKAKADAVVRELGVGDWVVWRVEKRHREWQEQVGPGRPGPNTKYRQCAEDYYELVFAEDQEAIRACALCDGLFALVSNDESLSVAEALAKYKYQPFLEKRYEQLKSVFEVAPVWLKTPARIAALLFCYFVVLLVEALLEREVRRRMKEQQVRSLPLYPEGRAAKAPTAELVLTALAGLRRHRLRSAQGELLRTFHDALPEAARQVLDLLGVDRSPFGSS
jgi:transposase